MKFLKDIQKSLEDRYGATTGLEVEKFVIARENFKQLGTLLVHQEKEDIDLALVFDRDILAAFDPSNENLRSVSVPFEEVSHFVYLGFNHHRGRNVTSLEMEMQSEVDRILLAFHGPWELPQDSQQSLLEELLEKPYPHETYEESRRAGARFIRRLAGGDPRAWSEREFDILRRFFHADLAEKLFLSADGKAPRSRS